MDQSDDSTQKNSEVGTFPDKKNFRKKRGGHNKKLDREQVKDDKSDEIPDDCPLVKEFISYKNELNDIYDRYERVYKLSRDITIESKRIIFQLHQVSSDESREKVMQEAKMRLDKLIQYNFAQLAKELEGHDRYQFAKAYSPGVQEFVEAITFYHYLNTNSLHPWKDILNQMVYPIKARRKNNEKEETADQSSTNIVEKIYSKNESAAVTTTNTTMDTTSNREKEVKADESISSTNIVERTDLKNEPATVATTATEINDDNVIVDEAIETETSQLYLPVCDYLLGIEDLTGELMRYSIRCVSAGKIEDVFKTCDFMRTLYMHMLTLTKVDKRDFFRKLHVMLQSLLKIENACHMIKLRGSELPKEVLANMISTFSWNEEDDPVQYE